MRRLQQKRSIAKFLCFLLILEMFVASPNVAEAKSEGISRGATKAISAAYDEPQMTITVYDPTKPENTRVVTSTVPSWITVSKPGYNTASFRLTFSRNATGKDRTATIQFTDGTYNWYAKITQKKYTAPPTTPPTTPPTKPPTTPPTKTPSKAPTKVPTKAPTKAPTAVPTSTPAPLPTLTASVNALNFSADGETKTVTISGYTGTLRADRGDTWFTTSVSGGNITVTATKNTSTARSSYFDVTDTGSGRSVRIQVNQAAPVYSPGPTKAPTSTPTPTPAETLPVKTKTLSFGAQGGQDTISLNGSGYKLSFSFPSNPSTPSGWVGMIYDGNTIKVKVERNKDRAPRSMKVKITDANTNQYAYVTINQKAAPTPTPTPYLTAAQDVISCDYNGTEESISFYGTHGKLICDYSWTPNTVTDWIHENPVGDTVTFTIDKNLNIFPREAVITVTDEKTKKTAAVTVYQDQMPNSVNVYHATLKVDSETISLRSCSEEKTIAVSGSIGALRADRIEGDWFTATVKGSSVVISAKKNVGDPRSGALEIADTGSGQIIRVAIVQEAGIGISKSALSVGSEADSSETVTLQTGNTLSIDYEWVTGNQRDWVSFVQTHADNPGSETKYKIVVKENPTYKERVVTVKFSNGSRCAYIKITQAKKTALPLKVSDNPVYFTIIGGTSEIKISNAVGSIILDKDNTEYSWMNVTKSGNNTFTIHTKENETGKYRQALITFVDSTTENKVTVTIWQHSSSVYVYYTYEKDKPNGGTEEVTVRRLQYISEAYGKSFPDKDPSRNGYTFGGWFTEKELDKGYRVYKDDILNEAHVVTLYAHFIKNIPSTVTFDLNYTECPKDSITCKAYEGKPFGELPTPPERVGFEFDGWYTVPNAYEVKPEHVQRVEKGTIFTGDGMSKLYAHWNVTVTFPDFANVGVNSYTTTAKEGWNMVIPDEVLKLYNIMGFKVRGWTMNSNSKVADKRSSMSSYSIPRDLKSPTVSLWAVNAEGQSFKEFLLGKYGRLNVATQYYYLRAGIDKGINGIKETINSKAEEAATGVVAICRIHNAAEEFSESNSIANTAEKAPEKAVEFAMNVCSSPYNATDKQKEDNDELINSAAVQADLKNQQGYINGQGDGDKAKIRVGETNFKDAGCGVIATYNALHSFGYGPEELEKLIEYYETNGYLMNCPPEIKKYLEEELEKAEKKDPQSEKAELYRSTLAEIEKYGADKAGGVGANPYAVDDVLAAYGLKTKEYKSCNEFLDDVLGAIQSGEHKKYIVDFWNGTGTNTGHFVFFETIKGTEKPIKAYNYGSKDKDARWLSFGQLKGDMIEGEHVRFINAYEVTK